MCRLTHYRLLTKSVATKRKIDVSHLTSRVHAQRAAPDDAGRYAVMTRRHVLLMLVGLVLAFDLAAGESPAGPREDDIAIVSDPQPSLSEKIDLGRRFGTAPCVSRQPRQTIREVLFPDAQRMLIHQFDSRNWRDLEAVRNYVRRLLRTEPEGGILSPGVYWAELRPAEILASVEFSDGQRRPLQLANGYAHFQDRSGCEWWVRYLGPDRSKWVVHP
jgi:hypothetical protein